VVTAAKRSRLAPFAFNTEQTYVLEFGSQKMRVVGWQLCNGRAASTTAGIS
jgi:hypothetical protein